jgi:uncharacterized protein YcaQ
MSVPLVPRRAVAALYFARQHLTRPRAETLTSRRLARFAEDAGGIQLDSINVLDRAHYLTVWSRFGPYDRTALDRLVYERREFIEYWAHAACLVPARHVSGWRRAMLDYHPRHTGWQSWLRKNGKVLARVRAAIAERGPMGIADFRDRRPGGASGWWSWGPAQHALHHLWMNGTLTVHSRRHFHKRFDLFERAIPAAAASEPIPSDEFTRWHLRRSLHAMGAATEKDLVFYLSFPRFARGVRRKALADLLRSGEVLERRVEGGTEPWYVLARDRAALARAADVATASSGTTFLTPFDSFLWHRGRISRLFGFDYRIEVYTPGAKRVHGYYTLPILHRGELVGRLDAKAHRADGRLEVRHLHFEPWFAGGKTPPTGEPPVDREETFAGIADALRSLAVFSGAGGIALGKVTPDRHRRAVARALASGSPGAAGG